MTKDDFEREVRWVNDHLVGKTVASAAFTERGVAYSITLTFTDGSHVEVTPEKDQGFHFSIVP